MSDNNIKYYVKFTNGPTLTNVNWNVTESCENSTTSFDNGSISVVRDKWSLVKTTLIDINQHPKCDLTLNANLASTPEITNKTVICTSPLSLNPGAKVINLPTGSYQVQLSASIQGQYSNLEWNFVNSKQIELKQNNTFFISASFTDKKIRTLFEDSLTANQETSFSIHLQPAPFSSIEWKELAGAGDISFKNNDSSSTSVVVSASVSGIYILEAIQSVTTPESFFITKSYGNSLFSASIQSNPIGSSVFFNTSSFNIDTIKLGVTASKAGNYVIKVVESGIVCLNPQANILSSTTITPTFMFSESGQYNYELCADNNCGEKICVPFTINVPNVETISSFTMGSGFNDTVTDILETNDGIWVVGKFTEYNNIPSSGAILIQKDGFFNPTFNMFYGFSGSGLLSQIQNNNNNLFVGTSEIESGFKSSSFTYSGSNKFIYNLQNNGDLNPNFIFPNMIGSGSNDKLLNFIIPRDQFVVVSQPSSTKIFDFNGNEIFPPYSCSVNNGVYTIDSDRILITGLTNIPATGSIAGSGNSPSPITSSLPMGATVIDLLSGTIDKQFTGFSGSNGAGVWKAKVSNDTNYVYLQIHDWNDNNITGSMWNGTAVPGLIKVNLTSGQRDISFDIGTSSLQYNTGSSPYFSVLDVLSDDRVLFVINEPNLDIRGIPISSGQPYILDTTGSIDQTVNLARFSGSVTCFEELSDGRFLFGGNFSSYDGYPSNNVIKINSAGDVFL